MDNKEMRRSFDRAAGKTGLIVVTAFAHGARLSLGVIESTKGGDYCLQLKGNPRCNAGGCVDLYKRPNN